MSNVPFVFPQYIPTAERTVRCSFPQHHVAIQQLTALIWEYEKNIQIVKIGMQNVGGVGWCTILWSVVKFRLQPTNFRTVPCSPKRYAIPHSATPTHTNTKILGLLFTLLVYQEDIRFVEYYSVHI
jgi:hypothetical protein